MADLLEVAGASAQFLDNPLQRAKRDVDVISGHVVFDYDVSRELAARWRSARKYRRSR
jgi:3-hydroxy-9,10-secoandrosta-1,3,5(10)-triene-9,17-dione monooxygenase